MTTTTDPRLILELATTALDLAAKVLRTASGPQLDRLLADAPMPMGEAVQMTWAYPTPAKVKALRMRAEGATWREICDTMRQTTGRSPTESNIRKLMKDWQRRFGDVVE